ncbi:unnamed protein product [Pseudo-nitzschia multistriata]|uniref:Uncharacterized protein n=1 Tax=Pseudo-nitzschia multistriata TaxID=183589 RepID=A0A448Z9A5_9STRA|nr:unnamed protein product [Pseudo-nitzschia multistriata]
MNHVEMLLDEFDTDHSGTIDLSEFRVLEKYLRRHSRGRKKSGKETKEKRRSSAISVCIHELAMLMEEDEMCDSKEFSEISIGLTSRTEHSIGLTTRTDATVGSGFNLSRLVDRVVLKAHHDNMLILHDISHKLYPFKSMLCVQDANLDLTISHNNSRALDFDALFDDSDSDSDDEEESDPDFESQYPPSQMRCLALVSHNGMKKTMREFVTANKNILKKFRLTGTNSTMTMLTEVFKDEEPGTVMFGPSCASGPLGGDAELVALMVSGKIGGVMFFQDPMDSHPHRADIDCLVRQGLVHNTIMAENPATALMLLDTMRNALMNGKAELIPSFFFSLQSPTVEAYKKKQKAVVESHAK